MRSKTNIPSSKNLEKQCLDMIHKRCKNDHFAYTKQLPIKKNLSSYNSAYKDIDMNQLIENKRIQQYRKKIAPPSLDPSLLKRSLHQSSLHYSPSKVVALPNLSIGSTYKQNFLERTNQKIVKGKQQDGFFIKMPWHDSPTSNYRKSYQKSNQQVSPNEKGKAVEGHLHLVKRTFNAKSVYQQCYSPLKKCGMNESKDCIKNKDHLTGSFYQLKGKSEYKSRYQKIVNKQNQPTMKSIKSRKRLSLLPQIKPKKGYHHQKQKLPKKSLKMKKTKSNPVGQELLNPSSTHERIFGQIEQN